MVAEAIGLDDEAEVGPEEIDLEVVDWVFAEGCGETGGGGDGTEVDLEVRVGEDEREAIEDPAEGLDAGPPGVVVEGEAKCLRVDQVALVGVVDCPLQGDRAELRRQVEEGLDRGGDREPLVLPHHVDGERRTAPDAKVRAANAAGPADGQVNYTPLLGCDSPEGRRAAMA